MKRDLVSVSIQEDGNDDGICHYPKALLAFHGRQVCNKQDK